MEPLSESLTPSWYETDTSSNLQAKIERNPRVNPFDHIPTRQFSYQDPIEFIREYVTGYLQLYFNKLITQANESRDRPSLLSSLQTAFTEHFIGFDFTSSNAREAFFYYILLACNDLYETKENLFDSKTATLYFECIEGELAHLEKAVARDFPNDNPLTTCFTYKQIEASRTIDYPRSILSVVFLCLNMLKAVESLFDQSIEEAVTAMPDQQFLELMAIVFQLKGVCTKAEREFSKSFKDLIEQKKIYDDPVFLDFCYQYFPKKLYILQRDVIREAVVDEFLNLHPTVTYNKEELTTELAKPPTMLPSICVVS